jgi:alpha-mannosidase
MRNRLLVVLFFLVLVPTFIVAQSAAQPGFTPNASAKPVDAYKATLDHLQSITDVPLNDWRTHEADLPHGEDLAIDDAQWKPAKLNEEWKSGGQWLRRTIEIPAEINGYDVRGSRIDLDVAVTSDQAIQISTFSNGSLIGRTDEDTQLPITLTNDAQPGQKFVIAVRVVGAPVTTKMYRAHLTIRANAKRPDPAMLRLEILSVRPVIDAYEAGKVEREAILEAAVKAINVGALAPPGGKPDQAAFDASLRSSQQELEKLRPFMKQFSITLGGNSHIDMAWLWPWTETVEVVRNTFGSALQMMREYPDLTFTMATANAYWWMEEKYPEMFAEIQKRVKEGRWEIVGGMWVEPDLNLPDGESLTRQLLYGKRYFKQKFGVDVKIGWNPDSFGYNWQLPQIYKKAGIDYFVTQKIYWNDTTKFPHKLFWWQAPDGSRLLTYFPHDYANPIEPVRIGNDLAMYAPAMWKDDPTKNTVTPGKLDMLFLFGVGDHGGGPTRKDLDTALEWKKRDLVYPQIKFGTAGAYFHEMEKNLSELNVPVYNDELYFEYHRGVQTTQSEEKKGNRKAEVEMLTGEKLQSITSILGEGYPQAHFDEAWKEVLFNQFHDILPGSGIAINYVDAARKYEDVHRRMHLASDAAMRDISERVKTDGPSVIVFNPLSWTRDGMVSADVQLPPNTATVVAESGSERTAVEIHELNKATNVAHLHFLAKGLPSLGYRTYRIVASTTPAKVAPTALKTSATSLENEFLKLTLDSKTGCITSLIDKKSNTEALDLPVQSEGSPAASPDGKPCGNLLQVFTDKPEKWDAWNIDASFTKEHVDLMQADSVKLVQNSPLRAVIRVVKHYDQEGRPRSTFTQDITVSAGVPRVDIRTHADWHTQHRLLKAAFAVSARNEKATFEIPYGSIERPTTRRTLEEQAQFEVPALRWADISDAKHGLSLMNDSKYGYDAKDNVLRLSLLRSPIWPDPNADMGEHDFTYSLYPHAGTWREANTVERAYELNDPVVVTTTTAHAGTLPLQQSFFSISPSTALISAVKKAQDGDSIIVRFYEWAGKKTDVKLTLPPNVESATETNLMEEPQGGSIPFDSLTCAGICPNTITIPTKPYEIKTVALHLKRVKE